MKKTLYVTAAVIIEDGKVFATQRGYGEFKDGWEFPGGKIENGETPEEALRREIMEELDTKVTVGELFDTVEYDYPEFHLSMKCYLCRVEEGDLVLNGWIRIICSAWIGCPPILRSSDIWKKNFLKFII